MFQWTRYRRNVDVSMRQMDLRASSTRRASDQPRDRQDARPHRAADATRPRLTRRQSRHNRTPREL